ncbi:MAG: glycyl-radical enzyme activating protein [Planctomycetes bacterium]|nr:glycyl-radical enzyme activating protein [Planctomycetota bacterium]
MAESKAISGRIFDVQRFSIHDGPGIRTTVFMKGCPLRCLWCHNPESLSSAPQISFVAGKCIGCASCFRACPTGAHTMGEEHLLDRTLCRACGKCTAECYAGALERVGKDITVAEVLEEVMRDLPFYETSGGGMTLSGGEPTLQIDFSEALLKGAKEKGLHCVLETCLCCEFEKLERIRSDVDLFLCDWKETDPARHKEFTGKDNRRIRENLLRLSTSGAAIRVRCPIIPGLNDREDHFAGIAELSKEIGSLEGVELMPYHRLGESKTQRFGLPDRQLSVETPAPDRIESWREALARLGTLSLIGAGS